jgi:hypothetical protein
MTDFFTELFQKPGRLSTPRQTPEEKERLESDDSAQHEKPATDQK